MKTILELQEELERVMPKTLYLDIEGYRPDIGGDVSISDENFTAQFSERFETLPEALDKAINWLKKTYP
jgi:hypothetical protein